MKPINFVARRTLLAAGVFALTMGVLSAPAFAQQWPIKPIRLVCPFPPGAAADMVTRLVAQKLSEKLNQPVVVDNRVGASGNIGTQAVAHSAADGYTLLSVTGSTLTVNPVLYKDAGFDPVKDFAPVSLLVKAPILLVVHPSVKVRSVQELIRKAKAAPGQLTYASSGSGQASHLAGALFDMETGSGLLHVPYKGGGPASADLLGGHVSMMFATVGAMMPLIKAGKVIALGAASAERTPLMPELPTIAESGVKGFEMGDWIALVAPAGTPEPIVRRINDAIQEIFKNPEVAKEFESKGFIPAANGSEALAKLTKEDLQKWSRLVKQANIKTD
jgi:tripartite-type tricarboxylate transporter receptor subunit TctC